MVLEKDKRGESEEMDGLHFRQRGVGSRGIGSCEAG